MDEKIEILVNVVARVTPCKRDIVSHKKLLGLMSSLGWSEAEVDIVVDECVRLGVLTENVLNHRPMSDRVNRVVVVYQLG